jgi:hypothetical protein
MATLLATFGVFTEEIRTPFDWWDAQAQGSNPATAESKFQSQSAALDNRTPSAI